MCNDLCANISSCAKFCGQISADVRISADVQISALGKYQKMFAGLWANISRHVKIYGHRVVQAQNTITTLSSTSDTIWLSLIGQFYWERESVDLNFGLLQFFCCSHFLSADLACLYLSFLNFMVSLYTNCRVRPYTNCKVRPYTNCKVKPYTYVRCHLTWLSI